MYTLSKVVTALAVFILILLACSDDDPTTPAAPQPTLKAFNVGELPDTIPGTTVSYGNIAFDGDGNLLLTDENNRLLRYTRDTASLETIATDLGGEWCMCVVWDEARQRYYVGTRDEIRGVLPGGATGQLESGVSYVQQLLIAPPGYGSWGGRLICLAENPEGIWAYHIDGAEPRRRITPEFFVDAEFGPDGTLYAVKYTEGQVYTVAPDGTLTLFVDGFVATDGIAIDTDGSRLWVTVPTGPGSGELWQVDIPSLTKKKLNQIPINGNFEPTGLVFDGVGNLIYTAGSQVKFIDYHPVRVVKF